MTSFKPLIPAFLFSISVHAFLGFSGWGVLPGGPSGAEEPPSIAVDTVKIVAAPPQTANAPASLSVSQNRFSEALQKFETKKGSDQGISHPNKSSAKAAPGLPMIFSKGSAGSQAPSVSTTSAPMTAADFMTDPQKGRIFLDYFGLVKERIHQTIRRKYRDEDGTQGVVSLLFVLGAEGDLQKVAVVEKETDAKTSLREMAVLALKTASPLPPFPKNLGARRIAFNLKIYFDDL